MHDLAWTVVAVRCWLVCWAVTRWFLKTIYDNGTRDGWLHFVACFACLAASRLHDVHLLLLKNACMVLTTAIWDGAIAPRHGHAWAVVVRARRRRAGGRPQRMAVVVMLLTT